MKREMKSVIWEKHVIHIGVIFLVCYVVLIGIVIASQTRFAVVLFFAQAYASPFFLLDLLFKFLFGFSLIANSQMAFFLVWGGTLIFYFFLGLIEARYLFPHFKLDFYKSKLVYGCFAFVITFAVINFCIIQFLNDSIVPYR